MSLKDKNVLDMLVKHDNYDDFLSEYLDYHEKDFLDSDNLDVAKTLSEIMQHQLDLLNVSQILWSYKPTYIKDLRLSKLIRLLDD